MPTSISPTSSDDTVAIVGVGLIGGSLAAAIQQRGLARRVIGVGRSRERLNAARHAGLIDDVSTDVQNAAQESQVVVVCTPVDRIVADVRAAAAVMPPGSLITDAGSVKGMICESLREFAGGPATFLGSHPLAGSEKQGFEHASPALFDQKVCVLTPTDKTPADALQRLHHFWQAVGMQTCELTPAEHDRVLAATSHLPHAVAAALASTLTAELRPFAASGFRDTTRIAAGDPDLWTAIFEQNSSALLGALARMGEEIASFQRILRSGDMASLKNWLQQAKTSRDALNSSSSASGNS